MINKLSNQDIFQNSIHLSEYGHFWLQKQQHGVGYYNNLRFIHKQMSDVMKTHTQTEFIDYLVNVAERLAATEADISFRSWWRTNLELKQFWTQ